MKIRQVIMLILMLFSLIVNAAPEAGKGKLPVKTAKSKVLPSLVDKAQSNLEQAQRLWMGSQAPLCLQGGINYCAGKSVPPNPEGAIAVLNKITLATPNEYKQAQALIKQIINSGTYRQNQNIGGPVQVTNSDGCNTSGQSCTCSNTGLSGTCNTGNIKPGLYCQCNTSTQATNPGTAPSNASSSTSSTTNGGTATNTSSSTTSSAQPSSTQTTS